jgi:hypothetical protein
MGQQVINNNDSGLLVRNGLNNMFTELYAATYIPFIFLNQTSNFAQGITANSWVDKIVISGTATIKVGTSSGADDILPENNILDGIKIMIQDYKASTITYYFTIVSGTISARIDTISNYIS